MSSEREVIGSEAASCSIVGLGATGSHLAWLLARLGAKDLTLYDGDTVAAHNPTNQAFGRLDVGVAKVSVLAHDLQIALGTPVRAVPEFVREPRDLGEVVFLCIDSMDESRAIVEQSVFGKSKVLFHSRMDAARCVTYAIDPHNPVHRDMWLHYWFPDAAAENETLACGGVRSVCFTPFMAAALLAESYSVWLGHLRGENDPPPQMRWVDLRQHAMHAEVW